MRNSILVSVWMVTYNHENYITKAINAILNQRTHFKYKLFIGDDCSTDNTTKICQEFQEKFPDKIFLFSNPYNFGPNKNALQVYEACFASGSKYIAMCEGDDYWTDPLKLQKQVDFLEAHPDYALCFHRAQLLNEKGEFTLHAIPEDFEENTFVYKDLLSHYNFITTASVLFKIPQSFSFPKWFEGIPFGDLSLYALVTKSKKIKCLNDTMSVYRIHSQGIFQKQNKLQQQLQYLFFYKRIVQILSLEEQKVVAKKRLQTIKNLAILRFPKNILWQQIYKYYLRFKF